MGECQQHSLQLYATDMFVKSKRYLVLIYVIAMISFAPSKLFLILARSNCTYTCPTDCVVTKYDITHSGSPRSKYDLEVYITSLSKKNQEMDQLDRKIKSLDDLCISPEDKNKGSRSWNS